MAHRQINLSNEKNRNAVISYFGYKRKQTTFSVDENGGNISTKKFIKSTSNESYNALLRSFETPNDVAKALIKGDPEINLQVAGEFISQNSKVYINNKAEIVFNINEEEIVYNPKGEIIEKRVPRHLESNINTELPLSWSNKFFPKEKIIKKFVFARKYQLQHATGLSYDMLFEMAKMLSDKKAMMLIGSGKGTGPVIFQDGGKPFRIFLEGRVKGDKYLLLMHLSNLELKPIL